MSSQSPRSAVPLPTHLVWDWNGTLQDDVQAAVNGINRLLSERELPPIDVARHRETFGFPVRGYYEALGFQMEHEDWDALAEGFHQVFLNDEGVRLRPGARPVLEAFRAAGVGMSVLSACETRRLQGVLEGYGILPFFEHVFGLDDLYAHSKLGRGRELLNRLGLRAEDVWFVGDTDHDWEVATAVGAPCLLLADGYQTPERLRRCGCPLLSSLEEVPTFFGLQPEASCRAAFLPNP